MDNISEIKKISDELKSEIDRLSLALTSLENNISILQKGDDNGSYWKGKNAYSSVEKCLTQIDSNRNLIHNLNKCSLYLENLSQENIK